MLVKEETTVVMTVIRFILSRFFNLWNTFKARIESRMMCRLPFPAASSSSVDVVDGWITEPDKYLLSSSILARPDVIGSGTTVVSILRLPDGFVRKMKYYCWAS